MLPLRIRQEIPADRAAVYTLVQEAFAQAEHRDGTEQDLVVALRQSVAFVPKLSLIAEVNRTVAGHILFTEAHVGVSTVLALAPLSVRPAFQLQGVGSALILEGHRIAQQLGYGYAVVLGSKTYYRRFGYRPAAQFGITAPNGIPASHLMAIQLRADAAPICGPLFYAKEFGI